MNNARRRSLLAGWCVGGAVRGCCGGCSCVLPPRPLSFAADCRLIVLNRCVGDGNSTRFFVVFLGCAAARCCSTLQRDLTMVMRRRRIQVAHAHVADQLSQRVRPISIHSFYMTQSCNYSCAGALAADGMGINRAGGGLWGLLRVQLAARTQETVMTHRVVYTRQRLPSAAVSSVLGLATPREGTSTSKTTSLKQWSNSFGKRRSCRLWSVFNTHNNTGLNPPGNASSHFACLSNRPQHFQMPVCGSSSHC